MSHVSSPAPSGELLVAEAREPAVELALRHPAGMSRVRLVELTKPERGRFEEAVDRLLETVRASSVQVGTSEFFDAAEVAEGTLPEPARAALAALRHGRADAVLLRGLPTDPSPGITPTGPQGEVETPPRGCAWLASVVRRLGHELAYASEKQGRLVHHIHPTREGARSQSNASWQVDLCLHTENAFHPIRPDFIVLYCVRSPRHGPVTRLALLEDLLPRLTDEEVLTLSEPRFTVHVVDSHRVEGEADIDLPVAVLGGSTRHRTVRWHESLRGRDPSAVAAARAFAGAAAASTRDVRLRPGDLLAFANDRCLHGRDRFDAQLNGQDRWLLRSYALRDLERVASYVTPARPSVMRLDITRHAGG